MIVDPAWVTQAKSYLGLKEITGPKHSPVIMSKIKKLGAKVLGITVTSDETPWCGTFMAWVMDDIHLPAPKIAVRATSWATWGQEVGTTYGCIGVFKRPEGGHVGIIVGVRINAKGIREYRVLGGNQSNSVSYTWIDASRRIASRWPAGCAIKYQKLPVFKYDGTPVSTNEA